MPKPTAPTAAPAYQPPAWFEDIATHVRMGTNSVFILHGDINCLVSNPDTIDEPNEPYLTSRRFWKKCFDGRDMVMFYNIASGLYFATAEMEREFRQIAGLEESKSDDASDPIASAKAKLAAKRGIPREPEACLPLVERVLRKKEGVALLVESVHFIAPSPQAGILPPNERANIERFKNWARSESIRKNGNLIIMTAPEVAQIASELRQESNETRVIHIPKPSYEERLTYIKSFAYLPKEGKQLADHIRHLKTELTKRSLRADRRARLTAELEQANAELAEIAPNFIFQPNGFDAEVFARATQGMSLRQILEVFIQAKQLGKELDLTFVKAKKKEILNGEYGEVMDVVEPMLSLDDIAGHDSIKNYFGQVLDAIRRGDAAAVPMGCLLMGPPGTGKTVIVEALATEAGFNFVKIKNVRSMWVGESEARMDKLIYGLKSLAPVVVMNDEADLADAQRDSPKGDSGVSERLMKAWMEFTSDSRIRGKVIIISCTNRPDRIDPALKRSGRNDERILVPMAWDPAQRAELFRVLLKKHKLRSTITDFRTLAAQLDDRVSGADIEVICLKAYQFASVRGSDKIDEEAFLEAISDFIPSANQREIDVMTLLGISESSRRSLLPANVTEMVEAIRQRGLVENVDQVIASLKERKII